MKKKVIVSIIAVILVASLVGMGIHVLHKDALATETVFKVRFEFEDNGQEVAVAMVHFFDGEDAEGGAQMDHLGDGNYAYVGEPDNPPSSADNWDVDFGDPVYEPLFPAASPWAQGEINHGQVNNAGIWEITD